MNVINANTGEPCHVPEPYQMPALTPGSAQDREEGSGAGVLSWCPGGNASGGICRPPNNHRNRWMEQYGGARVLPVGELLLPGTHHSAYDKQAPRTPSSETCQDVPVYDQLMWGIRALDLRVQFYGGASGDRRFAIWHSTTNGRYVEPDVLQALSRYRRDAGAQREIVVLNFHQFKDFTAAAHREFATVIKRVLGSSIVLPACKEAAVVQLWALAQNTVVSYNSGERDRAFWPGVNQRWIGKDTPSNSEMAAFISKVGGEAKGFGDLRSIQASYYSLPFFVPKDLSGDLMDWFAANDSGGPIAGHYIINSDWSLRQRLVDNIIYANGVRARQRNAHVVETSPYISGALVQTQSYGIFRLYNGNWQPRLTFAANTSGYPSIQLISSDAEYASEITWGTQRRVINKGDRLLFSVRSGALPELLASF